MRKFIMSFYTNSAEYCAGMKTDWLLLYRNLRPGIVHRAGDAGYRLVDL